MNENTPYELYRKALDSGERLSREEELILIADKGITLAYTQSILNGERFKTAERLYYNDPEFILSYSRHIIKGRWEEAEPFIKDDERIWNLYQAYHSPNYFCFQVNELFLEGVSSKVIEECGFMLSVDDEYHFIKVNDLTEEQKQKVISIRDGILINGDLKELFNQKD